MNLFQKLIFQPSLTFRVYLRDNAFCKLQLQTKAKSFVRMRRDRNLLNVSCSTKSISLYKEDASNV